MQIDEFHFVIDKFGTCREYHPPEQRANHFVVMSKASVSMFIKIHYFKTSVNLIAALTTWYI